MFNMLKITLLCGDTEVISIYIYIYIYGPAAVRRRRLIVSIQTLNSNGAKTIPCGIPFFSVAPPSARARLVI